MKNYQIVRALCTGLAVFIGQLLVYPTPPSLEAYWQPTLLFITTVLSSLGFGSAIKSRS